MEEHNVFMNCTWRHLWQCRNIIKWIILLEIIKISSNQWLLKKLFFRCENWTISFQTPVSTLSENFTHCGFYGMAFERVEMKKGQKVITRQIKTRFSWCSVTSTYLKEVGAKRITLFSQHMLTTCWPNVDHILSEIISNYLVIDSIWIEKGTNKISR